METIEDRIYEHIRVHGGPIKGRAIAVAVGGRSDSVHRTLRQLVAEKKILRYFGDLYAIPERPIPDAIPVGQDKWENPPPTKRQQNDRKKAEVRRVRRNPSETRGEHIARLEAKEKKKPKPRKQTPEALELAQELSIAAHESPPPPFKPRRTKRKRESNSDYVARINRPIQLEDIDRMAGNTNQEEPPVTPEQEKKILEETREYTAKMALPEIRIEPLEDSALKLLVLREIAVGLAKSGKQEASAQMINLADWINSVDEAVCAYQEAAGG